MQLSIIFALASLSIAASSSSSTISTTMSGTGGFINEKLRNLATTKSVMSFSGTSQSHLLHALEGLDRYPNYLNRWNERDIDELELSLQQKLTKVRQQRQAIRDRRTAIADLISQTQMPDSLQRPTSWEQVKLLLDHNIVNVIFQSRQFRKEPPSLHQVFSGETIVDLDAHLLETLMDQEVYDVYSLPLFQPGFCDELRTYVRGISKLGDASLNMGTRPIDLDNIGLSWVNDLLFHLILRPIAHHLYKVTECGGGDLDWRQGYLASYSAESETRNRLVVHTDDSEVTLNVGLGDGFEGGVLEFWGLRGDTDRAFLGDYTPVKGRAIIHAGRHFHDVTTVSKGDRFALILWARSWNGVRAQTCPCCWLNRREDSSCICGPRWN